MNIKCQLGGEGSVSAKIVVEKKLSLRFARLGKSNPRTGLKFFALLRFYFIGLGLTIGWYAVWWTLGNVNILEIDWLIASKIIYKSVTSLTRFFLMFNHSGFSSKGLRTPSWQRF